MIFVNEIADSITKKNIFLKSSQKSVIAQEFENQEFLVSNYFYEQKIKHAKRRRFLEMIKRSLSIKLLILSGFFCNFVNILPLNNSFDEI